jgi:hypothetical protein
LINIFVLRANVHRRNFSAPGAEPRVLSLEAESDADAAWKSGRFHVAAWLEIISSRGLRSAEID